MRRIYVVYRRISSLNFHASTTKEMNLNRIERDLTEIRKLIDNLLIDIKKKKQIWIKFKNPHKISLPKRCKFNFGGF